MQIIQKKMFVILYFRPYYSTIYCKRMRKPKFQTRLSQNNDFDSLKYEAKIVILK